MTGITRFDPFRTYLTFPKWFDDFDEQSPKGLKIRETDKSLIAEAVIAGVPAKEVEVEIEDGILTIKAEKTEKKETKNEYKSSNYQYYYTCALTGGIWNKADAEIKDGIVKVTIPKTEVIRPKKIIVKEKGK
jgi:HSP20 family protein